MGADGFEHSAKSLSKTRFLDNGCAQSGARADAAEPDHTLPDIANNCDIDTHASRNIVATTDDSARSEADTDRSNDSSPDAASVALMPSSAHDRADTHADTDNTALAKLVTLWPRLSPDTRRRILTLADDSTDDRASNL